MPVTATTFSGVPVGFPVEGQPFSLHTLREQNALRITDKKAYARVRKEDEQLLLDGEAMRAGLGESGWNAPIKSREGLSARRECPHHKARHASTLAHQKEGPADVQKRNEEARAAGKPGNARVTAGHRDMSQSSPACRFSLSLHAFPEFPGELCVVFANKGAHTGPERPTPVMRQPRRVPLLPISRIALPGSMRPGSTAIVARPSASPSPSWTWTRLSSF